MSGNMEPQLRVNVLEDNRFVFGDSEMRLLDAIAREGTLSEGAAALGLSYRAAWGKLRAVEAALGARLLETTVGGSGGGSSRLTPAAQRLVERYNRFRQAVGAYALQQFEACFGEGATLSKLEDDGAARETDARIMVAAKIPAPLGRDAVGATTETGEPN